LWTFKAVAAIPQASPSYGTFSGSTPIALTTPTPGATIAYCFDTTNTCTPSTTGTSYTVTSGGYLRTSATATGYAASSVASYQYAVTAACPTGYSNSAQLLIPPQTSLASTIYQFPFEFGGNSALAQGAQGVTSASGTDIIFCSGGVLLPFEQVWYTPTTGAGEWWIAAPMVSSSTPQYISVLWGKSGAGSQQNPATLWSNYISVYHMGTSSALSVSDSTAAFNGTNGGATASAGVLGGSSYFNGSAKITLGGAGQNITAGTVEAWVNVPAAHNGYQTVVGKLGQNGSSYYTGYEMYVGTGTANTQVIWEVGTGLTGGYGPGMSYFTSTAQISTGVWHYLVGQSANASTAIFIDGAAAAGTQGATASGTAIASSTQSTAIGERLLGSADLWTGSIDEVRISSMVESADWIKATYLAISSPGTFAQFHKTSVPGLNSQWYIPVGQWDRGTGVECDWYENATVGGGFISFTTALQTTYCPGGSLYPSLSQAGQMQSYTTSGIQMGTFNFVAPVTIRVRATVPGAGSHTGIWLLDADVKTTGSTSSGTFTTGETVVQSSTLASGKLVHAASGFLEINPLTGTADATHTWVGQSSGAVFTPSTLPTSCEGQWQGGFIGNIPNCLATMNQEIDINDYTLGAGPYYGYNSVYNYISGVSTGAHSFSLPTPTAFHEYKLTLTAAGVCTFSLDGTVTNTINPCTSGNPSMFLLIDQTMESGYAGTGNYPTSMQVDYVRICSSTTVVCNPGDSAMIFEDEFGGEGTTLQNQAMQNWVVQ